MYVVLCCWGPHGVKLINGAVMIMKCVILKSNIIFLSERGRVSLLVCVYRTHRISELRSELW
jgi:hypothetical protein